MSDTPELDRQHDVIESGRPQAIGEFLEWLDGQGIRLCTWRDDLTDAHPCPDTWRPGTHAPSWSCIDGRQARWGKTTDSEGRPYGTCRRCAGQGHIDVPDDDRFVPDPRTVQQLLADHFGIDLAAVEREQRALLEALRTAARG